ncbi:hypothetical protein SAMN06295879_2553 [Agreia bicolorata]|uniref:Uncharacterized protein n=1 Tax=Agreia bicolorata TaxID=110935 RepID=A0A1T4Y928_9MICO|nr:hypothetical protein [Agreia bicolorata]SKA98256.1 hypothetical protein SAMN06295879_2553 [Agreia bicolorata]
MKAVIPRIVAVVSIVGAAAAVGALLVRWIGYATGGAIDVCGSERWTPWTVQYESTGSTPVTVGFGLTPLGLSCSSGGNVTYPDEPLASHLVVLALILVVLAVALLVSPASSHPRFFAWTVAISLCAAGVAVPAGLGTAAYAISFAKAGWIDCGVPPVVVVGRGAIEAVHAWLTVFSVVPTGPLCTFASPAGDVAVFEGDVAFGSVFVVALAVAAAFAVLAARSKRHAAGT